MNLVAVTSESQSSNGIRLPAADTSDKVGCPFMHNSPNKL